MLAPTKAKVLGTQAKLRDKKLENLDPQLRDKVLGGFELTKDEFLSWQHVLYKKGWAAPSWPRKYGGAEPARRRFSNFANAWGRQQQKAIASGSSRSCTAWN